MNKTKDDSNRAEMKNLFYNPNSRKANSTFQSRGGRGGRGGYKKGNQSENGERIMNIETLSLQEIGLTFQGFFDPNLKDLIKSLGYSKYDCDRKIWIIPKDHKA